jgi:hypothetical protein
MCMWDALGRLTAERGSRRLLEPLGGMGGLGERDGDPGRVEQP